MIGIIKHIKDRIQGKAGKGQRRSSQWPKFRKAMIAARPYCAACLSPSNLELHHIVPYSKDPTKELDQSNVVVLCESKKFGVNCHRFFGHLGDYKKHNPDCFDDVRLWFSKLNMSHELHRD